MERRRCSTAISFASAAARADGVEVSAGPVLVTDQLPDSHFSKKIGTEFHQVFKKVNDTEADDGFSGYAFDGWVIFLKAAEVALQAGHARNPGIPPGADGRDLCQQGHCGRPCRL